MTFRRGKRPGVILLSAWGALSLCLIFPASGATVTTGNVAEAQPAQSSAAPAKPDYSKEAFVIEKFSKKITFNQDGTWLLEQQARIRIQSEAGAKAFGVISFPYNSSNQRLDVDYIRVHQSDGTIVSTPESSVQDLSSEVARVAPTYSDLREKQIPVRALGPGSVLEYLIRLTQTTPEIPGQFWYSQNFIDDGIVLEENLQITVPASKYVNLVCPRFKPTETEQNGTKTYFWKSAHLDSAQAAAAKTGKAASAKSAKKKTDIQLTTFRSWEEVGNWYRQLQQPQAAVTPAIKAKAGELTKGLDKPADKERALYNYVSTNFRYISLSFGQGRYQPHAAADVLANRYGDCKDKHTLFSALLAAAGIESWPALIGSGLNFDPDVPSPAQFNHLITVVPGSGGYVWLDTTPEVAPFGLLQAQLRDKQALVIPASGPPKLVTTPLDLPFPSSELFEVKGSLTPEGTLKARIDVTFRGDAELIFRSLFHAFPRAQWDTFVQNLSTELGFQGKVSEVRVDPVDDLTKPFHWSYQYERENYSDWTNRRITPPLPAISFPLGEADDKPSEPIAMNSPGEMIYRSSVTLPSGYSVEIPENRALSTSFADYHATYSAANGVLSSERRLTCKLSRIPVAQWQEYLKFEKAVFGDQGQYIQLAKTSGPATTVIASNNPEAAELLAKAYQSVTARDMNAARDQLTQVERINPKQIGLWSLYSYIYMIDGDQNKAFDAIEKEIRLHPDELIAYEQLIQMQGGAHREDDALATLKTAAGKWPDNVSIVSHLCTGLMEKKRYDEMLAPLQKALAVNANNTQLLSLLTGALLYSGKKQEGLAATAKFVGDSTDAARLNDAAYYLADTQTALPQAVKYAEKAVALVEDQMKATALSLLANEDFTHVTQLASFWDTLGWAYFQTGDYDKAGKYLEAAWKLSQNATAADHLGSVYAKQGKKEQAARVWRLALAANGKQTDAGDHLRSLGVEATKPVVIGKGKVVVKNSNFVPVEELSRMRTTGIPSLQEKEGSATFFVLFSASKTEDAQFIDGSEALKTAGPALMKAGYGFPFPDAGPEKIVRRGILSCSQYTAPNCQLTLLLPSTTRK